MAGATKESGESGGSGGHILRVGMGVWAKAGQPMGVQRVRYANFLDARGC